MSKRAGFFTNPGVIAGSHLKAEHTLTPEQQAALEGASEERGFTWRIRTVKAPQETSANAQRKAWAHLIASANQSNRR
jgi:hypothetical protein